MKVIIRATHTEFVSPQEKVPITVEGTSRVQSDGEWQEIKLNEPRAVHFRKDEILVVE